MPVHTSGGGKGLGRGRGRERILSRLHPSTEPDMGLDLTTLRSLPEPKSRVECSTD